MPKNQHTVTVPNEERAGLRAYIEERCVPVPFSGCWLWLRSFGSHGYGNATLGVVRGRVTTAQRVSFLAFKGDIPCGTVIQHSCDERACVNPDHLSLGTDKTNAEDKMRKGRGNYVGRILPTPKNRKLTAGQVAAIRASSEPLRVLARRCGVSQRVIQSIVRGLHYRDAFGVEPGLLPLFKEEIDEANAVMHAAFVANGNSWDFFDEELEAAG